MSLLATVASVALLLAAGASAHQVGSNAPIGLHELLQDLTDRKEFSGAVVIRGAEGIRFARGYGPADPFTGRAFTPETPVDSASLAKPVTAAAILKLARNGEIDLEAPVQKYLPDYPFKTTTIRHLLAHSAGLDPGFSNSIIGRTNADLIAQYRKPGSRLLFSPGTAFTYCNVCYSTLALLTERVSKQRFINYATATVALPAAVTVRPSRLSEWHNRAIGYRWIAGNLRRADSYEGELFYGSANLSISADQLARWGSEWWGTRLADIRSGAETPAKIGNARSGLTLGSWYCAPSGHRCHYVGHHEGFHHLLYWDRDRRLSVAMVTNNTLSPAVQQRLQRAIVAMAEGRADEARTELGRPLPNRPVAPGKYRFAWGNTVISVSGGQVSATRSGLTYPAYSIGSGIRYIPGLDVYMAADAQGRLHWLSLYEDSVSK